MQSSMIQSAPSIKVGLFAVILSVPQLALYLLESGDYTNFLSHKDVVKCNYILEALRYYHNEHQRKKIS